MSEIWSNEEVEATLTSYIWMLKEQLAGRDFVKAEVIRVLRSGPLAMRSKGSVERRFQNYSYIFDQLGLAWVRGYVPLAHVSSRVRKLVEARLATEGLQPLR